MLASRMPALQATKSRGHERHTCRTLRRYITVRLSSLRRYKHDSHERTTTRPPNEKNAFEPGRSIRENAWTQDSVRSVKPKDSWGASSCSGCLAGCNVGGEDGVRHDGEPSSKARLHVAQGRHMERTVKPLNYLCWNFWLAELG